MSASARTKKLCKACGTSKAWSIRAFRSHQKTCPGPKGRKLERTPAAAFLHIDRFDSLTKAQFDKILSAHGVHEEDLALISLMTDRGWHFLPFEEEGADCYVREPLGAGERRMTAEEAVKKELDRAAARLGETPAFLVPDSEEATVRALRSLLAKIRWARKKALVLGR